MQKRVLFQYNDIAILTLDSPVTFSQQIRPICLPVAGGDFAGRTGTVIGWGSIRESNYKKNIQKTVLYICLFRWSATFSVTRSQYSHME